MTVTFEEKKSTGVVSKKRKEKKRKEKKSGKNRERNGVVNEA